MSGRGRALARARQFLFGDRLGVVLFLGALCWFALTWRVGFFIADTYAVANTLVNVADGHLAIEHIDFSLTLGSSQPGLHIHGGRVYGRNYGAVYAALPVYGVFAVLGGVFDLRIALSGAVSLALFGCVHQLGRVAGRETVATVAGSVLALAVFGATVATATPLAPRWAPLLALQATTALAGAALGVALYRLLGAMHGRRVGVATGVAAIVATPVGFWATVPKRHVLTAALAVLTLAAFYASRRRTDRLGRLARAGAYLSAGFATAVHGGEGAVLLGVLLPVDLLTAPENGRRDLGAVAAGLGIGLVPFLVTNVLISGNPLLAPRWLEPFDGGTIGPDGTVQTARAAAERIAAEQVPVRRYAGVTAGLAHLGSLLSTLPWLAGSVTSAVLDRVSEGLSALLDAERLYHVFVRSGRIPGVRYHLNDNAVVELTLLESMPLAAAVLTGAGALTRLLRAALSGPRNAVGRAVAAVRRDPNRQTDLLAVGYLGALTAAYLPTLPLYSQITVRYLLPTMALWLYAVARLRPVRQSLTAAGRWALAAFGLGVAVGGPVLVGVLWLLDPAVGEAMQFHALLNLALAALALLAVALGDLFDRPAVGAVGLGVTAAGTTVFLSLLGLSYVQYGEALLPIGEQLGRLVRL